MNNTPEIRFNFDKKWTVDTVSSCAETYQGFPFDSKKYTKKGKYNVLTISNVGGDRYVRFVQESNKVDVLPAGISEYQILKDNDILISMTGNVGRVSLNKGKNNLLNQRVDVLQEFDNCDKEFLFQRLSSKDFENAMILNSQGAAQKNISNTDIKNYILCYPEIPEQKQIASFLSNADSLIDSKKKELEKTKQYKATMLYKMFPQDDKLVPEIRFKGFDGDWIDNKLIEIADFNPKSELPNTFEYVDLESVVGTKMVSHRTETILTAPSRAQRLAKYGDVFYQTVRPYQKNNYLFDKCVENYVFSTGYAQMRPKIDSQFLMSFIQTDGFVNTVLNNCTGTSFPAINPSTLSDLSIKLPINKIEQQKIGEFFTSLDSIITNQEKEIEILEHMKATLLSKMFA